MKKLKGRTFALGDLHGGYKALLQVLERSGFNKEEDQLISLGDTADGWPDVAECVEELLSIPNFIGVIGNHDFWLLDWLKYGKSPYIWLVQGGAASVESYEESSVGIDNRIKHCDQFFNKLHNYYVDENGNAFVHGGWGNMAGLGHENLDTYIWDRNLWEKAKSAHPGNGKLNLSKMYNKVFIGHTSIGDGPPMKQCNIWNLDTGGGYEGKLTIMNVDTEEFWQSDKVSTLYPNVRGRQ